MAPFAQAPDSLLQVDLLAVVHRDDLACGRHASLQARGSARRRQHDRALLERWVRRIERTAPSDKRNDRQFGSSPSTP